MKTKQKQKYFYNLGENIATACIFSMGIAVLLITIAGNIK